MTAVRPSARFGELELKGAQVTSFRKPQVHEGWINGGFCNQPESLPEGDQLLERSPLEQR